MSVEKEQVEAFMDLVNLLAESAGGMRKALIEQGFSESAAEMMAVNHYMMTLQKMHE